MAFDHINTYDRLVAQSLKLYDLPTGTTAKLLHLSENITYLVQNNEKNYKSILRINRPGYHTRAELDAEIIWMREIMKSTPLIVPTPIRSRSGDAIHEIVDSETEQRYTCAMYEFLKGKAPDEEDEANIGKHFESLGETTAYLHRQVRTWEGADRLARFTWDFESMVGENGRWGCWRAAQDMTPEYEKLFEKALKILGQRLGQYGQSAERFGLIHADLRLANLLVEEDQIKVIDFDDCGYGWFMHDLAAAVSFIEHKPVVPELVESWIRGYSKIQMLSREDLREIDTFILQRRLQLVAWMASHYDSDPVKELSKGYTEGSAVLAEKYIRKFGG